MHAAAVAGDVLEVQVPSFGGKVAVLGWPGWYAAGTYLGPGPALGVIVLNCVLIVLNCALIDLGKAANWAREAADQAADQAGPGPDSAGCSTSSVSTPPTSAGWRKAIEAPIEPCRGRSSTSRIPVALIAASAARTSVTP